MVNTIHKKSRLDKMSNRLQNYYFLLHLLALDGVDLITAEDEDDILRYDEMRT